ncbi:MULTISPECIES: hypothetical protein [Alteromonadaceae]|uniref:Uncharacterized protein n=1 Tax=Brumicola blandensis TaxID=3075611 RepID=A0AAW8QZP3_9ALTE|nr:MULTISPECIES: hypothetical protein [unclassified Alteromonas]MDT0581335.1 hypothetical protein [Alteromonas sp. W409]MDT0626963.1 hypothetical protein [Alteromonas sp. W364]
MREVIKMEADYKQGYADEGISSMGTEIDSAILPFFSVRKLRLIYNELIGSSGFEFDSYDAFKHQVMSSVAPQLELNKWQAIAARR